MPNILVDLVIDRVDLVDEGANTAAFIELYKRKEQSESMDMNAIIAKLQPEHAQVVQKAFDTLTEERDNALAEITKRDETLSGLQQECAVLKAATPCDCDGEAGEDGICKACGRLKKAATFDEEEVLKAMPEAARTLYMQMKDQKAAAEAELLKAKEAEKEAAAIAKAASLKALPIPTEDVTRLIKKFDDDEFFGTLQTINNAIESSVLTEVGKATPKQPGVADPWEAIEEAAAIIKTRDNVTQEKAIATAIKESPKLYAQYLKNEEGNAK